MTVGNKTKTIDFEASMTVETLKEEIRDRRSICFFRRYLIFPSFNSTFD